MKITKQLLADHDACTPQLREFIRLYPDGVHPTVEVLTELASRDLDVWWLVRLLPGEGPGSARSYALWCAQQVAHLCTDSRVAECLRVVSRRVADPASVTDADLAAAGDAAWAAAGDAARAAAWAAAWAAARDAARDAAGAAARDAAGDAAWDAAGDAAWAAAGDAARAAARDAAGAAARAAAWAAAWAAAGDAQIACLSKLLLASDDDREPSRPDPVAR